MSGAQTSPFLPNQLYDVASGQGLQRSQQNALLIDQEKRQLGAQDIEMGSRIALALLNDSNLKTEADRAAAYGPLLGSAQAQGYLKNAQGAYPGDAVARHFASLGISAKDQYDQGISQQQGAAARGSLSSGATAPAGGGTGGAVVSSLPIPARGTGGPGAGASAPVEWLPYFQEASRETGIPVDLLIAQARQESSFNPNARGAAGEIGVFQIKPSTAQAPGFGLTGVDPASLGDPRNNILFGARYLRARMGQGDPNNPADQARALAAYNGSGDPNYVANVNRYRPGLSPTDPNAAVTTYTPGGGPPTQTAAAAPGTGGGGGTTPPPYQVATAGGTVPPPPTAPAVAAPQPVGNLGLVRNADGSVGTPAGGGLGAPAAPAPQQTAQAAPAAPAPPAPSLPPIPAPEPLLPSGLTAAQEKDLEQRTHERKFDLNKWQDDKRAMISGNIAQQHTYRTEVAAREAKQQELARQAKLDDEKRAHDAAEQARKQAEQDELRKSKSDEADAERVMLAIAPKIRAGQELTPAEADQYDLARRKYAQGPLQTINDGKGGTFQGYAGREMPDRFPLLPGQREYAGLKPIPGTEKQPDFAPQVVMTGMLANASGQNLIAKTLSALQSYPGAVGLKGGFPDAVLQRTDPEGTELRALIGKLQVQEFHSMAGTAQSASEASRLQRYTPAQTDTDVALKTKLDNLLEINRENLLQSYRAYGPESGGRKNIVIEEAILGSIPDDAMTRLKKEPDTAKQFDRKYGKGAAKLVLDNG